MADMLVKLYDLSEEDLSIKGIMPDGFEIMRAMAPNKMKIIQWVRDIFGDGWASECDVAFSNTPVTCYVAVDSEKNIVGFACYEATCRNFFGPTGVDEKYRGKGIGKALLLKSTKAMKELGYGYMVIGGSAKEAVEFYRKTLKATEIEGSVPGVYKSMI